MPNLTVANVITSVRDKLGDNTGVTAGRVVSDSELLSFLQSALLEFRQITRHWGTAYFARRTLFLHVVPNIGLYPIDAYNILGDVSLVEEIWERKVESWQNITDVDATAGIDLATVTLDANHGRSVGDAVQVVGSEHKWLNGLRIIATVPSAASVSFTGVRTLTVSTSTSTAARMLYSVGPWNPVGINSRHIATDAPLEGIPYITLEDGGIQFNPVISERVLQLRALVGIESVPQSTDVLIYPESQEYLALKVAILAHASKGGNPDRIQALSNQLYGANGDAANIVGGAALLLLRGIALQGQQVRRVRPRFRPPRRVSTPVLVRF